MSGKPGETVLIGLASASSAELRYSAGIYMTDCCLIVIELECVYEQTLREEKKARVINKVPT